MKAAILAIIIALAMIVFILSENYQPKTITKTKYVTLTYNKTDTIERIRNRFRYINDSVDRWVYDSSWNNICRSYSDSPNPQGCQRDVAGQILRGQLNASLVNEYQNKWQKDSTWIAQAIALDSIKQQRIDNLIEKNEQLGNIKQRKQRIAKIGHIGAGLLGAILILKK